MKCEKCGGYLTEDGLVNDAGKKVCLNCQKFGTLLQGKDFKISDIAKVTSWNVIEKQK